MQKSPQLDEKQRPDEEKYWNRPKKQVIKSLSLAFRNTPAKQHDDESEQNNLLEQLCE